ncbi:hypothetical protein ACIPLR_24830 [Herbaspirillum huttiense]|jgi:hypothetical protein|uniref:hypothetical protein n=1 Tax=Herbaspirillum TaxID=963 RepID=UPI00098166B7|nr:MULTISPECIES: hypothetical protein [unclassified Herbaspirillum]MCP3656752.1 hypothetical protein [Herbaspirillum sp.]MCP3950506.1 hypothetical protein [Herbaspirillum sp.]MCP4031041.1 hypothetical protein [Herbaspirillum sp.]MRT31014.1 hypothetical protein [Herbaspirillum sp. CAH-3]ONN63792.1 hypothetical protein BTM36_25490 [Herbaspirillum sp. VT-16-41]
MLLKSSFINYVRGTMLVLSHLFLGMFAIRVALFLRTPKVSALRDELTNAIGYEARATVEHFLAAYGFVILAVLFLCIWYHLTMRGGPKISKYGRPVNRFQPGFARWYRCAFTHEVHVALVIAAMYLCCTVGWWEVKQAYFGWDNHPARGELQYEQIAADLLGAILAVLQLKLMPTGASWFACDGKTHS